MLYNVWVFLGGGRHGAGVELYKKSIKTYWLFVLPLLGILGVLVWFVPGLPSSVADVTPTTVILRAKQPAVWQDVLVAGGVLQHRLRFLVPGSEGLLDWQANDDQLIVSLPPEVPKSILVREAVRTGRVEVVEGGTEFLPVGARVKTSAWADPSRNVYQSVLTSVHFSAATMATDVSGKPVIEFVLTPTGDALLAAHSSQQRGYYLCVVVDGEVLTCPVIRTPLAERRGVMEFSEKVTREQVRTIAMLLCSGPLPVPLTVVD